MVSPLSNCKIKSSNASNQWQTTVILLTWYRHFLYINVSFHLYFAHFFYCMKQEADGINEFVRLLKTNTSNHLHRNLSYFLWFKIVFFSLLPTLEYFLLMWKKIECYTQLKSRGLLPTEMSIFGRLLV